MTKPYPIDETRTRAQHHRIGLMLLNEKDFSPSDLAELAGGLAMLIHTIVDLLSEVHAETAYATERGCIGAIAFGFATEPMARTIIARTVTDYLDLLPEGTDRAAALSRLLSEIMEMPPSSRPVRLLAGDEPEPVLS